MDQIDVTWRDFEGQTGVGQATALTSETGYFWFFNDSNVEIVVKLLDGRDINGHYWVFLASLTNVSFDLVVTDRVSGATKSYSNSEGAFASLGDTTAFPASRERLVYLEKLLRQPPGGSSSRAPPDS